MLKTQIKADEYIKRSESLILKALELEDYEKGISLILENKSKNLDLAGYAREDIDKIISDYKKNWKATGNFYTDANVNFTINDFADEIKSFNSYSFKAFSQLNEIRQFSADYNAILQIQASGEITWYEAVKLFRDKYNILNIDYAGKKYPAKAYFKMLIINYQKDVRALTAQRIASQLGTTVFQYGSGASANIRPDCSNLEGQLFSFEGSGEITDLRGDRISYFNINDFGYGTPEGAQGINCTHPYFPVVENLFIL